MMIFPLTFHQHIIHVDLDVPSNLMCKHLVHEPLVHCSCVLETEWHHFIIEETLTGDK